jgi:hypothetical protein
MMADNFSGVCRSPAGLIDNTADTRGAAGATFRKG